MRTRTWRLGPPHTRPSDDDRRHAEERAFAGPEPALSSALSLMPALIHPWALPQHLGEWYGCGSPTLAAAQEAYVSSLLRWSGRLLSPLALVPGVAGVLAIVALYARTRLLGVPLGTMAGETEAAGAPDLTCTFSEVALVAVLFGGWRGQAGRVVRPRIKEGGARCADRFATWKIRRYP